ncbi:MAG: hypothetical protein M3R45_00315 [Pseudomonadota bacterium]|nr:hypothetical protein [Pseudomonadota bacterium]
MLSLNSQRWAELQQAYGRTKSKYWKICIAFRSVICIALPLLACAGAGALPPPRPGHIFHDLVVGAHGELLVAHTDGVLRSVLESGLWQRTLPNRGHFVNAGPEGIYLLSGDEFGDIFHSRDVGATWTRTGTAAGLQRSIVAYNGALHGCFHRDIRSSRDGGKTWIPLATVPTEVGGCMYMRFGPDTIYAGAQPESLFANRIGSDRWTPISDTVKSKGIPAHVFVRDLHVDAAGTLYASTLGRIERPHLYYSSEERVYRSRDRGATWHPFGMTSKYTKGKVVGMRGLTVYLECIDVKSYQADVCSWSDQALMQTLGYVHWPGLIGSIIDSRLIPGADGRLYTVDMYGVHRWENELKIWRPLENNGIPDPYTGVVR